MSKYKQMNRFLNRCGLLPTTVEVYLRTMNDECFDNPIEWIKDEIGKRQPINTLLVKRSCAKYTLLCFYDMSEEQCLELLPKIRGIKPNYRDGLSDRQLKIFNTLADMKHEPVRTILLLLSETGLRISAMCNLEMDNIEIVNERYILRIKGKGSKYRVVPLTKKAQKVLEDYIAIFEPKDILFRGKRGAIKADTIRKHTRKISLSNDELKGVSPHVLRHTFATRAYKNGIDLKTLQMLLGHSDLKTTSRYIHPSVEDLIKGIDKL